MTEADELEWLAWRRNGIGASDVAGIVGVSPWSSPWSIWANKVGLTPDWEGTESTQFGTDLEPVIATWFHRETGMHVHGQQTRVVHPDKPWARATVDGFVLDAGDDAGTDPAELALGTFEAKYSGDAPWDEIPDHYNVQCQWQMFTTGLERSWLAAMHLPFGRPLFRVYEIERDQATINNLVARCEAFWRDHVVTGAMPPTDCSTATTAAISAVYGDEAIADDAVDLDDIAHLIERLRGCKQNARQLDRDIKTIENEIKARMGTATEGFVGDELVVTWRGQSRQSIDTVGLRKHEPDVARSFTRDSTYRVLRLPTIKETT